MSTDTDSPSLTKIMYEEATKHSDELRLVDVATVSVETDD